MQDKNELNDIILNKGTSAKNSKKILLAVATLGIILIVVVLLMNTLSSNGTSNLPQAPQPQATLPQQPQEEPLFEDVKVVEENNQDDQSLNKIAQKLKEESTAQQEIVPEPEIKEIKVPTPTPHKKQVKKVQHKVTQAPKKVATSAKMYYIQVGSFSKSKPDQKFLNSITSKGFQYTYHEVKRTSRTITKVLVGPFNNEKNARNALRTVRSSIEPGAFLVRF